jgi:exodeoxyribonuclease VII large subunit
MIKAVALSDLLYEVYEALELTFGNDVFWIKAELVDVKKQPQKGWCFAKLIEKTGATIAAEVRANFWQQGYMAIQKFEKATGQKIEDGLEVVCAVRVKFHSRYGLALDVLDIDISHAIGKAELDRQQTLNKLVANHPYDIIVDDGVYITSNHQLQLAKVVQRIALITATNSDGQRDFLQELHNNQYGYKYNITQLLTTVQGDEAHKGLINKLREVQSNKADFDAVAIVRGGGSQTDFKPFDEYELAEMVALFPLPVLTGIGHDRNTSIVDMMARQLKTPTKVATFINEHNADYERQVASTYDDIMQKISTRVITEKHKLNMRQQQLAHVGARVLDKEKQRWENYLPQINYSIQQQIKAYKNRLAYYENTINLLDPVNVLKQGYALVKQNGIVVRDAQKLQNNSQIETVLHKAIITSTINNIK